MRSYGQLIREITEEVMREQVAGKTFPVRKSMQKISLRVILRAVFGLNEGTRYQQLEKLLGTMLDYCLLPTVPRSASCLLPPGTSG